MNRRSFVQRAVALCSALVFPWKVKSSPTIGSWPVQPSEPMWFLARLVDGKATEVEWIPVIHKEDCGCAVCRERIMDEMEEIFDREKFAIEDESWAKSHPPGCGIEAWIKRDA